MPFSADDLDAFRRYIEKTAGGYLRNIVREPGLTCSVCATPVNGYDRCYPCNQVRSVIGLADRVASLTYAVAGTQAAYMMRGYKGHPASERHQATVSLLIATAVAGHSRCLAEIAGTPATHWSTIPSLPAIAGEHALHELVRGQGLAQPLPELPLIAAAKVSDPRSVNAAHFSVTSPHAAENAHVLLIDDTWTRGGHAQSAAAALSAAGAAQVSVLTVARWIDPNFANNKDFIAQRMAADYDASVCPWSGGACP